MGKNSLMVEPLDGKGLIPLFDITRDNNHVYHVDGVRTDSVTQILTGHLKIEFYHLTDFYKERGSEVDRCCVMLIDDELVWKSMDPRVSPYVSQFKAFMEATGFQPVMTHGYLANPQFSFAGELDILGFFPGSDELCVVDIKTGASMPYYRLQTALYALAVPTTYERYADIPFHKIKRFGLFLGQKTYKLKPYKDSTDFAYAQSICLAHRAKGIYA